MSSSGRQKCGSQGERSVLYGGCWSVSQPNLCRLSLIRLAVWGRALSSVRHHSMAFWLCRVFMHSQPTRNEPHLSALLCLPPFPMLDEHPLHYIHLQSNKEKKLCGTVSFHYACLLPYRWQYRYVTTVLPAFAKYVFYGASSVFIWLSLIRSPI